MNLRTLRSYCFSTLLVGSTFLACGGDTDSSTGASSMTVTELGDGLVTAFCDTITECGPVMAMYNPTFDCVADLGPSITSGMVAELEYAIANGTATYDGTKAAACIEDIAAMGCNLFASRLDEACGDVINGTVALGDACDANVECVTGLHCDTSASCPGTCAARGAAGTACEEDDACVDGLGCDDESGQCAAPAAVGDTCGDGIANCGLQLMCQGADDDAEPPVAGECAEPSTVLVGADGDDCHFAGDLCADGLVCILALDSDGAPVIGDNNFTLTCGEQTNIGRVCTLAIPEMCPAGQYCGGVDFGSQDYEGVCIDLPGAGSSCTERGQCASGLECLGAEQDPDDMSDGSCLAQNANGGSCTDDDACLSEHCVDGKCEPTACIKL